MDIGDRQSMETVVEEHDIKEYADITEDTNPLHLNEEYAEQTLFKDRIAHGMLLAGFISNVLESFEGLIVYKTQNLNFEKPVYVGDSISVIGEIVDKSDDEYTIETWIENSENEKVVTGEAVVLSLDEPDV